MGLDTYATELGADDEWEVAPDEPFEGIRLCGGLLSGGRDSSSIRGKVYEHVVRPATGESLYQERIDPATVAEIAIRLRAAVESARREGTRTGERGFAVLDVAGEELDPDEAEHLARWFEVCAARGYALVGWW